MIPEMAFKLDIDSTVGLEILTNDDRRCSETAILLKKKSLVVESLQHLCLKSFNGSRLG